ncbi:MAG: HDOD domain-containing protein, partial [Gemmatimonadota bacterium]|nr:HDOD domain-containing protein [Gemmatimonadota bacterium]
SVGPMHQYLSKPCETGTLKSALTRSCDLRGILADEKLQNLISRIDSLPSLPSLYTEIVEELQKPESSVKKVGRIISKDMGMSAKVLQLVNSAFFGVRQHIANPDQAVTFLGLDLVKMLVLTIHVFSQFNKDKSGGELLDTLWNHSISVGAFAKKIAETEKAEQRDIDHACMAGLLHDLGKLILSAKLSGKYGDVLSFASEEGVELASLESEMLGATHAEVGAYLLGLWGLSDPIVEALAFHHCPGKHQCDKFNPVTAVHAADVLEHRLSAEEAVGATPEIDREYLAVLGLEERVPVWEDACLSILKEQEKAAC